MDRTRSKRWEGREISEGAREREREREVNCEWRKNGSVDDETRTCRRACASHVFTIDVTCPYTRQDWEGVRGGKAVHFP